MPYTPCNIGPSIRSVEFRLGLLPIAAIKLVDDRLEIMPLVQAIIIDAPTVGVGTWLVEAFYPASRAEQMIRLFTPKFIARKHSLTGHQGEIGMENEEMQMPIATTNRAITVQQRRGRLNRGFEPHCSTMTTAENPALYSAASWSEFSSGRD